MKKFVTVCEGGNVRSVALAFQLKCKRQDAIACSWRFNHPDTQKWLFHWADRIVIMQKKFKAYIPEEFHHKLRVLDVGEDRFGNAFHPELQAGIAPIVDEWEKRGFEI